MPWGGGRGRCFGGGRGYGWGVAAEPPSAQDERGYLTDRLAALESEMKNIRDRLEGLREDKGKDKR